jgi:hypothetical protein
MIGNSASRSTLNSPSPSKLACRVGRPLRAGSARTHSVYACPQRSQVRMHARSMTGWYLSELTPHSTCRTEASCSLSTCGTSATRLRAPSAARSSTRAGAGD